MELFRKQELTVLHEATEMRRFRLLDAIISSLIWHVINYLWLSLNTLCFLNPKSQSLLLPPLNLRSARLSLLDVTHLPVPCGLSTVTLSHTWWSRRVRAGLAITESLGPAQAVFRWLFRREAGLIDPDCLCRAPPVYSGISGRLVPLVFHSWDFHGKLFP